MKKSVWLAQEQFLGLISVSLTSEYAVDAETGEFTGTQQTFVTKIRDYIFLLLSPNNSWMRIVEAIARE